MNKKKQKLELIWIGKDERPKLEPRILIEDPELSYHAKERRSDDDIFDNIRIHGDNLLALKALYQDYAGKVKCIYIDPPFNTGAAFENYEDGLEHSIWLQLMKYRLEYLYELLNPEGVIWIHIDDKELAYLKVICDEVFNRKNFLNMIVVKTSDPSGHKTVNPSPYSQTEYILMYAKCREKYKYEQRYVETNYDPGYNRYILNRADGFEKWATTGLNEYVAIEIGCENTREARKKFGRLGFDSQVAQFALENADSVFQPAAISNAAGRAIVALRDRSRLENGTVLVHRRDEYEDVYVLNGRQVYFYSSKLREIDGEIVPSKPLTNLWSDIPYNGIAREGGVVFKNGKKPEKLVERCIELTTEPGDIVLDSFAGSGTTGAVAHKMNRRWIMIELGNQAETHCVARFKGVVDGSDQSGISKSVNWKGGGGFRYYRLSPSLLEIDKYGNWIISKEYNAAMLAEALCKNMGFVYDPSQDEKQYWRHGYSTETDFIFVTTASMTHAALKKLSEDVGPDRTLLVCCKAFNANADAFDNLTIKKIPHAVLTKCEWGKDDYSLNVANLPMAKSDEEVEQDKMKEELPLFAKGEE